MESQDNRLEATSIITSEADWDELVAYTLGVQAYLYGYPWSYMQKAYWDRVTIEDGGVNEWMHIRDLRDASHQAGGGPNNDTLYSMAAVYVGDEPLILSVPAIPERYYTFQIVDFMGDNFAYVGMRATGTDSGNYAIVGPSWQGTLPSDVKELPGFSSTPWVWIQGRTLVDGAEDLDNARALQDQYKLTPLSQWNESTAPPPVLPELWEPYSTENDPLAEWKTMNRAMIDNPPDRYDAELLAMYKRIGIGPGLDVERQSESVKRGLERAAVDGLRIIDDAFAAGYVQKQVNGWNFPPPETGRPSATRNWLFRAMQARSGMIANNPEEAVYVNVSTDANGELLLGTNRYELRFEAGNQPDVNAFWSVTMYNKQYNLVANPIDRYSLGDRSGMKIGEDGSLTIYLQSNDPGPDKHSNWLPTPEGEFLMFLRAYLPGDSILSQWWVPPGLTRVDV